MGRMNKIEENVSEQKVKVKVSASKQKIKHKNIYL